MQTYFFSAVLDISTAFFCLTANMEFFILFLRIYGRQCNDLHIGYVVNIDSVLTELQALGQFIVRLFQIPKILRVCKYKAYS